MAPLGARVTPKASRLRPSVRGLRPVAIRMTSASMSATFSTAVFILKVMPCFSRYLRRRLAMSLSRAGRHSFRNSMTVTSEPKRWNTLANSMPMTPAPIIQRRLGRVSRFRRPVESTTRGSSAPGMGSHLVSEPVAMMMGTSPNPSKRRGVLPKTAFSRMRVILGCERIPSTPLRNWGTTCAMRSRASAKVAAWT